MTKAKSGLGINQESSTARTEAHPLCAHLDWLADEALREEGIEPYGESMCGRCGHSHSAQEPGAPCTQCLALHRFEDRCCHSFVHGSGLGGRPS